MSVVIVGVCFLCHKEGLGGWQRAFCPSHHGSCGGEHLSEVKRDSFVLCEALSKLH